MRLVVHVAIFMLSCAALANSLMTQMEMRSVRTSTEMGAMKAVSAMRTGSLVIYKTTPDVFSSHVRRTADTPHGVSGNICPVGVCQDV